jgi:hypothetical protein
VIRKELTVQQFDSVCKERREKILMGDFKEVLEGLEYTPKYLILIGEGGM